jgi:putative Mg2+ transporter-C (MgtC) family protein
MENQAALTGIDMLIRLGLAFTAGTIIGFERSKRRQVAGLRTHILISTGACLLMLLSIWLPQEHSAMKNGDPGRIAAQVVSGIGFLGAGAIIRLGNNVKGLTTAASLWLIAAVGLAIGAGMFIAAACAELISLITLSLMVFVEKKFFPAERSKTLELHYKDNNPDAEKVLEILKTYGVRAQSMDVNQSSGNKSARLKILVSIPDITDLSRLVRALKKTGNVGKVEIKEKY